MAWYFQILASSYEEEKKNKDEILKWEKRVKKKEKRAKVKLKSRRRTHTTPFPFPIFRFFHNFLCIFFCIFFKKFSFTGAIIIIIPSQLINFPESKITLQTLSGVAHPRVSVLSKLMSVFLSNQ